jgi:hypothetical protein
MNKNFAMSWSCFETDNLTIVSGSAKRGAKLGLISRTTVSIESRLSWLKTERRDLDIKSKKAALN